MRNSDPHRQRNNPRSTDPDLPSLVRTAGCLFDDGVAIEMIRDSASAKFLLLGTEHDKSHIGDQLRYKGRVFGPLVVDDCISQILTLPTGSSCYESTPKLFEALCNVLSDAGFPEYTSVKASVAILASWFPENLPTAPTLSIAGPETEANLLLDLLGCLVRHPLPIIGINAACLTSLPVGLQPTLLINCECASPSLLKLLRASDRRSAHVVRTNGRLASVYGAKVVYTGSKISRALPADTALLINLAPTRGKLPIVTAESQVKIAQPFQPMLLNYRHRNHRKVAQSDFDLPQFGSGIRMLARTFGAPVVDAPVIRARLESLLQAQAAQLDDGRWLDPHCIAIEALLACCHRQEQRAYVGELALAASAIMAGRGSATTFEAKEMGITLRKSLALSPKRFAEGFAITLTDEVRRSVHELARDFEVAALEEGPQSCSDCRAVRGTSDEAA